MSARTRARGVWTRMRFDSPREAGRRSAVLTVLLAVGLVGVSRAYRASSPRDVVPPESYARHGSAAADWVVTGYLAGCDAVGRAWLAVASWIPESVAWLLVAVVLVSYYAAAVEYGWRAAKQIHRITNESEVSA